MASLLQNAPEGVAPETCGAQPFSGFVLNEWPLLRRLAWILGTSWNILDLISRAWSHLGALAPRCDFGNVAVGKGQRVRWKRL